MKLVRYGTAGEELPGLIDGDGAIRDLSQHMADVGGDDLAPDALARVAALDTTKLPLVEDGVRLGSCIARPHKFLAIGLNYHDHALELGADIPEHPVLFSKATSSICGPHDGIILPPGSEKTDWEVELGIVIGSRAKHIDAARAFGHVAGYCVVNDVSERDFQFEYAGQWTKGKSYDRFGPVGPWLVTRDEVADPHALDLWLDVNGERQQEGSTATMIFALDELIAHVSRFVTLEPGDLITTGTPPGVGVGKTPPKFLRAGDVLTFGIGQLGEQRHDITAG